MNGRFGPLRASSPAMPRPALRMSAALTCAAIVMSACSVPPPSAAPAQSGPAPDEAANHSTPAADQARDDGGFADPRLGEDPAPTQTQPGMTDPALIARVKQRFGDTCRPERRCGGMLGIDCDAAVDGPYYYVEHADLKVVSTCGGACMRGCTDCPPKAWACKTY